MRLCANENVPGDCVAALRQPGHDVLWIRDDAPGSRDDVVLARAHAESRLLLTFDKDFGELVFRRGKTVSLRIVLFRLRKPSPDFLAKRVAQDLEVDAAWDSHFAVVDDHSIRLRPLP